MKNMTKKIWIICVVIIVIVLILLFYSMERNSLKQTTMETYRDLLEVYFEENAIDLTEGTAEYREYCQNQLIYETDEELKKHEQYEKILDYMSLYLAEYDELSAISEDNAEIDMQEFFTWTFDEAEKNILY